MLPSNPRAGGGLPNNPRSGGPGGRQQRRARPSRGEDNDTSATSSRPSRSHRPGPSSRREPSRSRGFDQTSRISNDSSTSSSSASSSGGSFLDRVRNGTSGYASSITTAEDDYESENRKASGRGQVNDDDVQENESAQIGGEGYGWTIWGRVATAASSLTVNVSKAWAGNIAIYAGEETPPGEESRLTRAMKAYHLEKARDPADLPAWLFDEDERRPRRSNARERREDIDVEPRGVKQSSPVQKSIPPRGLRDVYDAVSTPATIHQSSSADAAGSNRGAPRKGTDRLRALREAKHAPGSTSYTQEETSEHSRAIPQTPRARVGLPGGPGRNRRV